MLWKVQRFALKIMNHRSTVEIFDVLAPLKSLYFGSCAYVQLHINS